MDKWLLEHYHAKGRLIRRIPVDKFPFVVGRMSHISLRIESHEVSRNHAEFITCGDDLVLKDLGSINGTFVNHKPITRKQILRHGDIIHFANNEYRLIRETIDDSFCEDETNLGISTLTRYLPRGLNELQELLNDFMLTAVFQEIVGRDEKKVFGFESLGRGAHPKLTANPGGLFRVAESSGSAVLLSEMMRASGVNRAMESGITQPLFVNTHPHELENPDRLLDSLATLRKNNPSAQLVLEIHEEAVANHQTMDRIKRELKRQHIRLAYDDFGAGQARLLNLVETPPDFLKFDMAMVQGLHKAPLAHWRLVESLVKLSRDAGIIVIGEGIDAYEDAEACWEIGFDYLQGYYFSPHLRPH